MTRTSSPPTLNPQEASRLRELSAACAAKARAERTRRRKERRQRAKARADQTKGEA